jgi:hypothetical protein
MRNNGGFSGNSVVAGGLEKREEAQAEGALMRLVSESCDNLRYQGLKYLYLFLNYFRYATVPASCSDISALRREK